MALTEADILKVIKEEKKTMNFIDLSLLVNVLAVHYRWSERKIAGLTDISKSEVHRLIDIAKLDDTMKSSAKEFNTQKYVLLEWNELPKAFRREAYKLIVEGKITKRAHLRHFKIKNNVPTKVRVTRVSTSVKRLNQAKTLLRNLPKLSPSLQPAVKEALTILDSI